jgi:hypothetical protein
MNRRTFQQILLMATTYEVLPFSRPALALESGWQDLMQPLAAEVQRLLVALESIGEPLPPAESAQLKAIYAAGSGPGTVDRIEAILRPHVLLDVEINPESRVSVTRGAAKPQLVEHGWRSFLLRVHNLAKDTSILQIRSSEALPMGRPSGNATESVHDFTIGAVDAVQAESRWIALSNWDKPPLQPALSGLEIEYRILQIYSRDRGPREASLEAVTWVGEQDLGFRSSIAILFDCVAAQSITLHIHDAGQRATAALVVTDPLGRVYPAQGKRSLPDLWFQRQIYRRDGEMLSLPSGSYSVEHHRGPEYLKKTVALQVKPSAPSELSLSLERWVQPSRFGYYSGDTHIHASGCSHYESPSEGVTPEVMERQVEGEALDVSAVLTWAPGFLYQGKFFSGHVHPFDATMSASDSALPMATSIASAQGPLEAEPILRYDIEVSGFPSSHCGHLVLLRLKEQKYPGTVMPDDWPSWNLPILKWAKSQGAITGYAHSGWGMVVDSTELPNYIVPKFDSCGANEYLVDITHEDLLDFVSGCDTWPFAELNLWYHVLNCGFKLRFAGETDFPCITDYGVGGGRSYVKLGSNPVGDQGYSDWLVGGLQHGQSYFGDGRSHIFDFRVDRQSARASVDQLEFATSGTVRLTASVCARLEPEITPATKAVQNKSAYLRPYWHLERARIASSRKILVELVVNGIAVQRIEVEADGQVYPVAFNLILRESSWVSLRIMPSSHTSPVTLLIGGEPVRASKKSAMWCRRGVDACWEQKSPRIRPTEMAEARKAYDHARTTYDRIISESSV